MTYWTKVRLSIVVTFTLAIIGSYVADQFPAFFGDWTCSGATLTGHTSGGYALVTGCQHGGSHSPTTHWGYRHWLLCWMGILAAIAQLIYLISLNLTEYETN